MESLDDQDPAVKNLLETLKALTKEKESLEHKVICQLHQKESLELNEKLEKLDQIKRQLSDIQKS